MLERLVAGKTAVEIGHEPHASFPPERAVFAVIAGMSLLEVHAIHEVSGG